MGTGGLRRDHGHLFKGLLRCAMSATVVAGAACAGARSRAAQVPTAVPAQAGTPAVAATPPSTMSTPPSPALPSQPAASARLEPATRGAEVPPDRLERLLRRNMDPAVSLPETLLENRIATWKPLPVGERIARWAELFVKRTDNVYCFGPKAGCYVGDSLLVQDYKLDCVSLFYRCNELARATSPRDAVLLALTTRFAHGAAADVVRPSGAVEYDNPAHLDYSEDFAATGLWGHDATHEVGADAPETPGTNRYPAGTRRFIPKDKIRFDRLRDGDLLLFVLDEKNEKAHKLRQDYGLLVGHQAIVRVDQDTVYQIHAAQSNLSGLYTGNHVVKVPLRTYLTRLEKFKGIMVVRAGSDDASQKRP